MLRSGFLLGLSGAAAILTLVTLPTVRAHADRWSVKEMPALTASDIAKPAVWLPGTRPVSIEISPVHPLPLHYATMPRPEPRAVPAAPTTGGPSAGEKEPLKPRRITREGCEAPLSSLVGPEARRMVPGRCMA